MISILDLGLGNCLSLQNAFSKLGWKCVISRDLDTLRAASHLVLPGVGSFDAYISKLYQNEKLLSVLKEKIVFDRLPTLGICLGMHILMEKSEEGGLPGLHLLPGSIKKFKASHSVRVPNVGWQTVLPSSFHNTDDSLFDSSRQYYFCHSYYADINHKISLATSTHGSAFMAAVGAGNILGVQFHPEKSHVQGLDLLDRFAKQSFL